MDKLNESPMAALVSKVSECANEGDPKAQELMRCLEEFRLRAEEVVKNQEKMKKGREAEEERQKLRNEVKRKMELSQWIFGITRGVGAEAKILTASDLDLISRHHIGIFETDVVELNKIVIGPNGPEIAKGWVEDFQKLSFPDGGKEGLLQVKFDDDGTVSDIRIKRK